jgi:hypothetical protein
MNRLVKKKKTPPPIPASPKTLSKTKKRRNKKNAAQGQEFEVCTGKKSNVTNKRKWKIPKNIGKQKKKKKRK